MPAAGVAFSGQAWLLAVPALYLLGRSYGTRPASAEPVAHAEYGVGAALAGFVPATRR